MASRRYQIMDISPVVATSAATQARANANAVSALRRPTDHQFKGTSRTTAGGGGSGAATNTNKASDGGEQAITTVPSTAAVLAMADDNSPTTLTLSVEGIITQSKKLRTRVSELGRTQKVSPDLRALASVHADVQGLKACLSKLAKNATQHTDVKIRAGGEEHRLRDAEATLEHRLRDAEAMLLTLARDTALAVSDACSQRSNTTKRQQQHEE
eukprot:CAMPEP_0171789436 /NCGR_PEP_ID=MMETSP0991-20121206/65105_1 /TAXON_ID=483369 /ORGANISM="non described non described, Strain CCMP2098" /LENGTH=212 /DNA_ID=CAMNT_0012398799 /DNA_START=153 /DNA_END=788 /DNA_ORIENTATION=-